MLGWLLAISIAISVAAIVVISVPDFLKMYNDFGVEMPLFTKLFLSGYWLAYVVPAFTLTGLAMSLKYPTKTNTAIKFSIVLSILLLVLFYVAALLPIYFLGV